MGFWNRLFRRPMTPDRFARLIQKRIRQSGDDRELTYDADAFELHSENGKTYLGNTFAEYNRCEPDDREAVLRTFLATWHTAGFETPDDFADARADLMPALRSRSYAVHLEEVLAAGDDPVEFPYQVIGEHLAATLVYDLPHSMQTVNAEQLATWGVSFYEAMEVAKQNLAETTDQYAQIGSVYTLVVGDSYDATRLLLTDLIEGLELDGSPVAVVPNRERLYLAGADDEEGLAMLAGLVEQDLQHERAITGRLFRLEHGEWEPWLPPADHASHTTWRLLEVQSLGQDYHEQKARLDQRHAEDGRDVFVASFAATQNEQTGQISTYATWAKDTPTWLPETDSVVLSNDDLHPIARVPWQALRAAAGDLMQPLGLYPERWAVGQYPDPETIAQLVTQYGVATGEEG